MASLYSCISLGIFTSMFGHLLFENIFKLQAHKFFDDAVTHADSADEDKEVEYELPDVTPNGGDSLHIWVNGRR